VYRYSIFSLNIESNAPLPGLRDSSSECPPDVRIWIGELRPPGSTTLRYTSPAVDEAGRPAFQVYVFADGTFHLKYYDGVEFQIHATGSDVWMWPNRFPPDYTGFYLFGLVLGFVLRLKGVVPLHAAGILVDGAAVAVLGPSGSGKSTTAAAFSQLGYEAITDDIFALADHGRSFSAHPGHSTLRLWPDAVEKLFGSADALPRTTPSYEKRSLDLGTSASRLSVAVPVSAIVALASRGEESSAPRVEWEKEPRVLTLLANTYAGAFVSSSLRAHEFDILSRVAGHVPVLRAFPHADPNRLPEFCRRIVDRVREVRVPAQSPGPPALHPTLFAGRAADV
jgi:hypothetical protein